MSTTEPTSDARPRRRRLLQYSLRTMLLLAVVVALSLGIWTRNARIQREAVNAIQQAQGTVWYDFQQTAPRTVATVKPPGPQWLRTWFGQEYFDTPVNVTLFRTPKDEGWVRAVNDLRSINTLLLSGENVTDEILDRFERQPHLLELHLSQGRVTDQGLANLTKFPNLRWLVINHTTVTDSGLAQVRKLAHLEELVLTGTGISNEGIPDLTAMNLRELDVRKTAITADGRNELRRRLPNCRVLWP